MTISIDQHIQELRAELRNAVDKDERREIAAELATAEARLAVEETAFAALMAVEPPH
jgi:hypothetical protein